MKSGSVQSNYMPPVVIGGIGGSGTRLIAQCLIELGFFMGHDLNSANDNLWFTLLFKRSEILSCSDEEFDELVEVLFKGMTGSKPFTEKQIELINGLASKDREQHPSSWLRQRAYTLLLDNQSADPGTSWGWKEPNSHIVLDRLNSRSRGMKYIHVIRNGLDMAYSANQNQLRLWGRHFIQESFSITPYHSLKYWCIVHRRVLDIGKSMDANFLFLNYDDFCLNPENGITKLCEFLGLDHESVPRLRLSGLTHPPRSIGRFKQFGTKSFAEGDVAFVRELGFDVDA